MRYFNTAGPVNPEKHYYVSHRLNDNLINQLIKEEKYFILHAPRQSGKTTAMIMLAKQLNQANIYKALYINIEPAQISRNNVEKGIEIIIREIKEWAADLLEPNDPIEECVNNELPHVTGSSLKKVLRDWSVASDKPILLFIDEIDSLVGDTLISVLRQLRSGHMNRPKNFPQSIGLIGVRMVPKKRWFFGYA
jgi:DNA polymerase III delta prime subunit